MSKQHGKSDVEKERQQFRSLLLHNPNYFGTQPDLAMEPVTEMTGNTKYEELTCLGFNKDLDVLEATVAIKRSSGYNGSLCSPGSLEYVRFYINYGTGWEDVGVVAFDVHDIPNFDDCADDPTKPLSYVVTQPLEPRRNYCGIPTLPRVRAVLSWEAEPPAGDPDWAMIWGNRLERHIQIKPRFWLVGDIVHEVELIVDKKVKLPPMLEEVLTEPIPQPEPPPLSLARRARRYQMDAEERAPEAQVAPHRFGFEELQALMAPGAAAPKYVAEMQAYWEFLDINWLGALKALEKTKGDVSFEELTCLGLDPHREWLAATFEIKRPSGYSGGLCTQGSKEYVAFWADWDDTCEWEYLDTLEVTAHDIEEIPAGGLHYTVALPVDLEAHRRSCEEPKVGRVRAVLSWSKAPCTTDPDAVPHWGNRLDAHVPIKPGEPVTGPMARISILGGVGIADIHTGTSGMTKPLAQMALSGEYADPWGSHARTCPFGGVVRLHALPNVGYEYLVTVRKAGLPATEQVVTQRIWVVDQYGNGSWHNADPVTGRFDYLPLKQNILNVLAAWSSSGDGLWEIRLQVYTPSGGFVDQTPWYRIRLDNTAPDAQVTIDGGACDQYTPGTTITGKFVARDAHFGAFSLNTLPNKIGGVSIPEPTTPTLSTSQTALAPGDPWTLDTSSMPPCGYVIQLHVADRTIRNSRARSHNGRNDEVGFCLLEE